VVTQSLKKKLQSESLENIFIEMEHIIKDDKNFDIQPFLLKKEQFLFEITTVLDFAYQYLFSRIQRENKYKTILLKEDFLTENPNIFQTVEKVDFILKELSQMFVTLSEVTTLKNSILFLSVRESVDILKAFIDE